MDEIAGRLFSSRRRVFIFALVLAAVTIFAYRPAWNGGFLWDDDVYITNNELLTAPDGLRRIWFSLDSPSQYFPLVYTTFPIEHAVWGPGSVVGWSNFCAASRAGGIGRLDHRTQKCTDGLLLFAHATCLDCVC